MAKSWAQRQGGGNKLTEPAILSDEDIARIYYPDTGPPDKRGVRNEATRWIKHNIDNFSTAESDHERIVALRRVVRNINDMMVPVEKYLLTKQMSYLLNINSTKLGESYSSAEELYQNTEALINPFKEALKNLGSEKLDELIASYPELKPYRKKFNEWIEENQHRLPPKEEQALASRRNTASGITGTKLAYESAIAKVEHEGVPVKELTRKMNSQIESERIEGYEKLSLAAKKHAPNILEIINRQVANYAAEAKERGYESTGDYILSEFSQTKRKGG